MFQKFTSCLASFVWQAFDAADYLLHGIKVPTSDAVPSFAMPKNVRGDAPDISATCTRTSIRLDPLGVV